MILFSKFVDSAVSKTINLPNKATVDDVKKIFLDAMDIPDDESRAAFLDKACGGDTHLRGRVEGVGEGLLLNFLGIVALYGCKKGQSNSGIGYVIKPLQGVTL